MPDYIFTYNHGVSSVCYLATVDPYDEATGCSSCSFTYPLEAVLDATLDASPHSLQNTVVADFTDISEDAFGELIHFADPDAVDPPWPELERELEVRCHPILHWLLTEVRKYVRVSPRHAPSAPITQDASVPLYLILHHADPAEIGWWVTDTPYDESSGTRGTGHQSLLAAVLEAHGDTPHDALSKVQLCDFTDLAPTAWHALFPDNEPRRDLMRQLNTRSVPFNTWLLTHLQMLYKEDKLPGQ